MNAEQVTVFLGTAAIAVPGLMVAGLGIATLLDRKLSERAISLASRAVIGLGLICILGAAVALAISGKPEVAFDGGAIVSYAGGHGPEAEHFRFGIKFIFDRLSVPVMALSYVLCAVISAFASAYLHREKGFLRFFFLLAIFLLGMVVSIAAGTIETLFAGWELVGLSSALLVAFYQERSGPVLNGQRIWTVYRFADAAFLLGAVALHHITGEGDFARMVGSGAWPGGVATVTSSQALFAGTFLLIAAAGKSALVPFSGWLPRAMEGPTPSSAVFYGALSVHLGAYLLLRISPLIEASLPLAAMVTSLGVVTAIYAAIARRSQTDIKSQLCFASLTQVGIIVAEIGLGLRYLALAHLIGHACLRTLQFLRAPSALSDAVATENAIGERSRGSAGTRGSLLPAGVRLFLYRFSLERGFLDTFLNRFVAGPFVRLFQFFDAAERKWTQALSGAASRESDAARPSFESHEYLP